MKNHSKELYNLIYNITNKMWMMFLRNGTKKKIISATNDRLLFL